MAIERGLISSKSQYIAVKNDTYVYLAVQLGIIDKNFSSANNIGNVMESLFWCAYAQKRYDWILNIVKVAMEYEFPHAVPVADLVWPPVADDVATVKDRHRDRNHDRDREHGVPFGNVVKRGPSELQLAAGGWQPCSRPADE